MRFDAIPETLGRKTKINFLTWENAIRNRSIKRIGSKRRWTWIDRRKRHESISISNGKKLTWVRRRRRKDWETKKEGWRRESESEKEILENLEGNGIGW